MEFVSGGIPFAASWIRTGLPTLFSHLMLDCFWDWLSFGVHCSDMRLNLDTIIRDVEGLLVLWQRKSWRGDGFAGRFLGGADLV